MPVPEISRDKSKEPWLYKRQRINSTEGSILDKILLSPPSDSENNIKEETT